jgi:23S rRNA (pseudouridine1915-N3)-methyltransferase
MIKIICVGKIKEDFYKDAILEFKKRLSKYTKLEIIEIPASNFDLKKTLKEEGNNIMKVFNANDHNILMDITGYSLDSLSFANRINDILTVNSNITFIIGGSYGVSDEIRSLCNERLSFSKMTFPFQLFRVILLEQLYRAFKIMNHEEYHK